MIGPVPEEVHQGKGVKDEAEQGQAEGGARKGTIAATVVITGSGTNHRLMLIPG